MFSPSPAGVRLFVLLLMVLGIAALAPSSYAQQPPDEAARLIGKLKDKKPEIRLAALVQLEKYMYNDDRVLSAIADIVTDTNPNIHQKVADLLTESRSPLAVDALIKLLKDPKADIRNSAIEALGMIGDPRAVEPLLPLWKAGATDVRVIVARALWRIGDDRAVPALLAEINNDDIIISEAAIHALGCIGDQRAVEPLLTIAKDTNLQQCGAAVEALGSMREVRVMDVLLPRLTDPKEGHQLYSEIGAAASIGDPRAVEPLIALFKRGQYVNSILHAFEVFHDTRTVEPLCDYLVNAPAPVNDFDVRGDAALLLGALGDKRVVPALVKKLSENKTRFVSPSAEIIRALGQLGDEAILPVLSPLVNDKTAEIRLSAIQALGDLHNAKAYDILAPLVKDPQLGTYVLFELAKVPDKRVFKLVTDELDTRTKVGFSYNWNMGDMASELATNPACTTSDLIAILKKDVFDWGSQDVLLLQLARRDESAARIAIVSHLMKYHSSINDQVVDILKLHRDKVTDILLIALEFSATDKGDIAQLLGKLGDPRAEGALLPLLDDEWGRGGTLIGLGYVKSRQALPQMLKAAKEVSHTGFMSERADAILALGLVGDPQAVDTLLAVMKEPVTEDTNYTHTSAITALGMTGDPRAHDVLLTVLKSGKIDEQQAALRGMVNYPQSERLTQQILSVFSTSIDNETNSLAASALTKAPGVQITDELIRQLNHKTMSPAMNSTHAIAAALSARKDPKAVPALINCLSRQTDDPLTRIAVLQSLAQIGDQRGVLPAMRALHDHTPEVRAAAAETLKALTGNTFGEDHAKWVAWWLREHK